jgi:hypothetical protein
MPILGGEGTATGAARHVNERPASGGGTAMGSELEEGHGREVGRLMPSAAGLEKAEWAMKANGLGMQLG